jgi:4-amino-4-deoxy-L-arabinose transferase-like glycosyltransferase
MNTTPPPSRTLLLLWGGVLLYFALNALTQLAVSGTADLDQAEQLLLSQSLQAGYGAQPPLYTYLVKALFAVTGAGLAPLLGLKAVMLSVFAATFIALGRQFGFTLHQHLLTLASLVFLPQLIWESQRDLTHSVLATTLAALTLLQVVRTRYRPALGNFLLLGALAGLGLISKYNYVLFLAALTLATLAVPQYRAQLSVGRVLAVALIALCIAAPHLNWVAANLELATSGAQKMQAGSGNPLSGLGRAAFAALAFLSPLWLFSALLLSPAARAAAATRLKSADGRYLLGLLLATLLTVAAFVIVTGAQHLKDRWYQPLLFHVPLLIALLACPTPTRGNRAYLGLGLGFALLVAAALPARTLFAERLGIANRPNLPYAALLGTLATTTPAPTLILAENHLLGGNARPLFPAARIHTPRHVPAADRVSGPALVLCETPHCDNAAFRLWLTENYGIDVRTLAFTRIEQPYRHAPSKRLGVDWARTDVVRSVP